MQLELQYALFVVSVQQGIDLSVHPGGAFHHRLCLLELLGLLVKRQGGDPLTSN